MSNTDERFEEERLDSKCYFTYKKSYTIRDVIILSKIAKAIASRKTETKFSAFVKDWIKDRDINTFSAREIRDIIEAYKQVEKEG
jgi:hypothetical protein